MAIVKKKNFTLKSKLIETEQLDELVGGDINSGGGDRNVTNNSEIETGPVQKPFNDDSSYEKGVSTTTDRAVGRYRQNIPWFAVYSYGGSRAGRGLPIQETNTIIKKKTVEEKIEDLVKKTKDTGITDKGYNNQVSKVLDIINNNEMTDEQLENISKAILAKKTNPNKTKKL